NPSGSPARSRCSTCGPRTAASRPAGPARSTSSFRPRIWRPYSMRWPTRPGAALTVLTAVVGEREAPLVSGLERSSAGVQVVRRCADLVELLSAAAAGLARAVVLSADLQRL